MGNKVEIIDHTADIGIKVYGKTIEELFKNSAYGLYKIIEIKYEGEERPVEIKLESEEIEGLLVKFLNELIYYIETKRLGDDIERIEIEKDDKNFKLKAKVNMKNVKSIKKEVKSATYHNLKIEKKGDIYTATIIFDL